MGPGHPQTSTEPFFTVSTSHCSRPLTPASGGFHRDTAKGTVEVRQVRKEGSGSEKPRFPAMVTTVPSPGKT